MINKTYEVSIFGSCVSRDIIEYNKSAFDVKSYIARQSIVSAVSKPVNCTIDEINLESNFQKNQVYGDLVKNTFEKLNSDGSKFLLIDLIDERFKLVEYENTIVTYSPELMNSKFIRRVNEVPRIRKKELKGFLINNKNLDEYMQYFYENILKIYNSENIIIHKARMLDYYRDVSGNIIKFSNNNLKVNKELNELLEYMYEFLEIEFPNAKIIDICHGYVADENHKWGLAPMHYEKEYYLKALDYLINYLEE